MGSRLVLPARVVLVGGSRVVARMRWGRLGRGLAGSRLSVIDLCGRGGLGGSFGWFSYAYTWGGRLVVVHARGGVLVGSLQWLVYGGYA